MLHGRNVLESLENQSVNSIGQWNWFAEHCGVPMLGNGHVDCPCPRNVRWPRANVLPANCFQLSTELSTDQPAI